MIDDENGHRLFLLFEFEPVLFFHRIEERDRAVGIGQRVGSTGAALDQRDAAEVDAEVVVAGDAGQIHNLFTLRVAARRVRKDVGELGKGRVLTSYGTEYRSRAWSGVAIGTIGGIGLR